MAGGDGVAQAPENRYSSPVNINKQNCSRIVSVQRMTIAHHCSGYLCTNADSTFALFIQFAFAYIFNLVIGVGALALPLAFTEAGLILGTLLIVTLAFMSFMTTSYVIEAMAAANAYNILKERRERKTLSRQSSDIQKADLVKCKQFVHVTNRVSPLFCFRCQSNNTYALKGIVFGFSVCSVAHHNFIPLPFLTESE